jgi:iron complex outermembrane receptor protein
MKVLFTGASAIVLTAAMASQALAQSATAQTDSAGAVEAIVVTGTRTTGLKAVDSAAPVQVVGADILKRTSEVNLMQSLSENIPSLQAQYNGGDQEEFSLSYKLRGLSPTDTLVLVNGERRHPSANVAVGGGAFGGGAAPDISFIPTAAIDHVEVLTDGAAAQYGTDAIAGVVNIILKKADHGGTMSAQGGQYYDGGGLDSDITGNVGFEPFHDAFINITLENHYHGLSFRGNLDPRVIPLLAPGTSQYKASSGLLASYPLTTTTPFYPFANRIAGDGQEQQTNLMFNSGYNVTPDIQVYMFGSAGYHDGRAYENYRLGSQITSPLAAPLYPAGFNPMENNRDTDYAVTVGAKGAKADSLGEATWNVASDYGRDAEQIFVLGSGNAALYYDTGNTPQNFFDGAFVSTQSANTVDLTQTVNAGLFQPVTLAAGGEYRVDSYQIVAGDPASYYSSTAPKGGGAQSFYGYGPSNAGYHQRDNWAGYFDINAMPIKGLTIDGAVRYEDYSDFGGATVEKLTSRYDINDMIAIRGTASTGFRAPTLGEGFYSGINVGPTNISGIFAPNSSGAKFLGLNGLKPESSTNYSIGLVTHFLPRLTMTLDAYSINIENRILMSGSFYGYNSVAGTITSPSVLQALAANGIPTPASITSAPSGSVAVQSFVNGAATLTRGVDYLATYPVSYGAWGHVDYSLAANYTTTGITSVNAPPANVNQKVVLLSPDAASTLTTEVPKYRFTAGAYWTLNQWAVNVRENYYGAAYGLGSDPVNGSKYDQIKVGNAFLTDLEVSYTLPMGVKLAVGATNLLNVYPTKYPAYYQKGLIADTSNGLVGSLYPSFAAWNFNGGSYYGRVSWAF